MQTNETPRYDASVNTTGCCPRFNPEGWDGQELHFKDKRFLRPTARSVMHMPLNMGKVFSRVNKHIDDAEASDTDQFIVLSRDISPWSSEHLFSVTKSVLGEEMTELSGDFLTKVFEGSYSLRQGSGMRRCGRSHAIENQSWATPISSIRRAPNAPRPMERTMSLASRP